jgi:hypothetical protein
MPLPELLIQETNKENAVMKFCISSKSLKDYPLVDKIIHTSKSDQPLTFCCSNEQLADLRSFLKSNGCVVGID